MRKNRQRVLLVFGLSLLFVVALAPMDTVAATPDEIEDAIVDGVAWLAAQQNRKYGNWPGGDMAGRTGFGVLKLIDRAFDLGFETPFDEAYEYSGNVTLGLNEIFWFSHFYGESEDKVYFDYDRIV